MSDAELSEDARQVPFDGPIGDEECGRDLTIRPSLRDEGRNAFLGGSERARGRCATTDTAELATRSLRPECGPDPVEDRQSLLERHPCLSPSLGAALRRTERQEGATTVERDSRSVMRRKRQLVLGERGVELSGPSREEPSAALAVGQRRGALETTSVALVPSEDLDGLGSPAELDERFDQIDDEPARAGLRDRLPTNEREGRFEVRNDVLGCAEDERDVAERLGAEVFVGAARRFEHSTSCVSRLLEPTQLGLHEGLQRKVVHGKERLTRLVGRLSPGSGTNERRFEVSEEPLDVAEEEPKPRWSVLVAEVVRVLDQLDDSRACPLVGVDPLPVLGESDQWLVEDAPAGRGVLQCRSPVGRARGARSSEQRLRREPRYEHIRGQRVVAELQRQSEGGLGVPQHLVEPEHPDAGRGEALVRDRERLTIWAGLGDDLDEQLGRFVRCLVEADPRENDGRTGALLDPAAAGRSRHAAGLRLGVSPPLRSAGRPPPQLAAAPVRGARTASTHLPYRA